MSFASIFRSFGRTLPLVTARARGSMQLRLNDLTSNHSRCLQCIKAYSSHAIDPSDPRTVPNTEWEKRLTPEQYATTREKFTEPPFSGIYVNNFEEGVYNCLCCGAELFSSETKYDSGDGWPSFNGPIGAEGEDETKSNILRITDTSHGMMRTEVICKKCDSHLGHVFPDGPEPTGQRFCINSRSLLFQPKNKKPE